MKTLLVALLIGIIGLAPAVVMAQATSPSGGSQEKSSPSGGDKPGAAGGSSGSGSSPSASPPGSSSSPSASPSDALPTNQADCEKAGHKWQAASSTCEKEKK